MITPSGWLARFRSAALVLAGLLHLLSIPAEPVVHGWLHTPVDQPGWYSNPGGSDGTQLHPEAVCVVCQGINEHALPEKAAQPSSAPALLASAPTLGESRPTSVSRTRLQARAPPA